MLSPEDAQNLVRNRNAEADYRDGFDKAMELDYAESLVNAYLYESNFAESAAETIDAGLAAAVNSDLPFYVCATTRGSYHDWIVDGDFIGQMALSDIQDGSFARIPVYVAMFDASYVGFGGFDEQLEHAFADALCALCSDAGWDVGMPGELHLFKLKSERPLGPEAVDVHDYEPNFISTVGFKLPY